MFGHPKLKHLTDEKLILIPSTTLVYMPEASVRNKDLDADQKVTGLSVRQTTDFLVKVRSRCLLVSHGEMTPAVGGHLCLISAKIERY